MFKNVLCQHIGGDRDELFSLSSPVSKSYAFVACKAEETLGPIPAGFTRFFHGTSLSTAAKLIHNGIRETRFKLFEDFGKGFYCTDSSRSGMEVAIDSALAESLLEKNVQHDELYVRST